MTSDIAEYFRPNEPEIDELLTDLGERAWRITPAIVGLSLGWPRRGSPSHSSAPTPA